MHAQEDVLHDVRDIGRVVHALRHERREALVDVTPELLGQQLQLAPPQQPDVSSGPQSTSAGEQQDFVPLASVFI